VRSLARLSDPTPASDRIDHVERLTLRLKLAVAFAVLVGVGCGASTYAYLDAALLH
jgi:hypothetical protein